MRGEKFLKKRSKMPSRILALLMAALMAVTSAPITAFAAEPSEPTIQSTSTIIDDPVSGTTGSGWDNIDGGSSKPETTPEPDESKPVSPPEGEVTSPEGEGDRSPLPSREEKPREKVLLPLKWRAKTQKILLHPRKAVKLRKSL